MNRPVERFTVNVARVRPRPAVAARPASAGSSWWPLLLLATAGVLVGFLAPVT